MYEGTVPQAAEVAAPVAARPAAAAPAAAPTPLATRLYVNLASANRAEEVGSMPVDGVGLLRAEFMVVDALDGRHPRALVAGGEGAVFVDDMAASLSRVAAAFGPRPVVYRTMDFRSNEFRELEGGDEFEPVEENPMIGYRGCFRYVNDAATFRLELETLARVREEHPNVQVMIPFVRTKWELEACLELIDASPLGDQRDLHVWVMAEVPSIVPRIPDYVGLGIDGVSIGSNDLTQLMLGVDRDSEVCAELFDESRRGRAVGHRADHRRLPPRRHHLVVVRPGPVEQPGVRRAPGAVRHHLGLGRSRRRRRHPDGAGPGRATADRWRRPAPSPDRHPDPTRLRPGRPTSTTAGASVRAADGT